MSVCLLVFASSKASDYMPVTLDRLKQFFPKVKSYLGIDSYEIGNTMQQYYTFDDIILYSMNDTWSKKMHDILLRIKESYIFFLIENNIFVEHFSHDDLKSYVNTMQEYNIDQLRMIAAGIIKPDISQKNVNNIYKICGTDYSISLQPAIWNKNSLQGLISKSIGIDYRDFEVHANKIHMKYNNYFIYTDKDFLLNEHNFSYGCPVFHALTYGKWVNESALYIRFLYDIQNEYKIDLRIRGFLR